MGFFRYSFQDKVNVLLISLPIASMFCSNVNHSAITRVYECALFAGSLMLGVYGICQNYIKPEVKIARNKAGMLEEKITLPIVKAA